MLELWDEDVELVRLGGGEPVETFGDEQVALEAAGLSE